MAERRMFTKKVTDDDNFMSLSSSAQALYLHLSMSSDDDGFCNQVSSSMFKAHASVQDLQALLEKRYIYQFESGVIVIKHWRMANALRKDRYTPTAFREELAQLNLKDNGAYTMVGTSDEESGCRLVASCLPQKRIDKDSKDKDKYICAFDEFWKNYPRKQDKGQAYKQYLARLNNGYTEEELLIACKNYAAECEREKREQKYIKHGKTFLSINEPFKDYLGGNNGSGVQEVSRTDEEQRNAEIDRYLESDEFKNDNDLPFV